MELKFGDILGLDWSHLKCKKMLKTGPFLTTQEGLHAMYVDISICSFGVSAMSVKCQKFQICQKNQNF